jgi:nitroreductase
MKYDLSEINDIIKNRRSIYPEQFSDRKVHREQIETLITNATWAPTHGMTQPWRFKVFMNEGLEKLSKYQSELYQKTTLPEKFSDIKFNKLKNRPLVSSAVIGICMKRQDSKRISELDEIAAVACSVQNMYLTATAYGLGVYWSSGGPTTKEETKLFLNLNEEDKCLGFFYIGYPAIDWPKGQRKPIEYVTEWIDE